MTVTALATLAEHKKMQQQIELLTKIVKSLSKEVQSMKSTLKLAIGHNGSIKNEKSRAPQQRQVKQQLMPTLFLIPSLL